ncbi:MAG: NADPH:quinone reductase-like Zn-dependent oxidoreductase [Candidatus Paceibacteria bacterium]|jgi:NADPH:quinone reductase-like Zn-dependent oxidoreductase
MQPHLRSILGHIESGDWQPVVDRAFAPDQVADALRLIHERKNFGKVLLDFSRPLSS